MSKSFNLIEEKNIPELNATAKLYVHKRTGARLLSVINDDENKVFSINFRTTPKDSTGVAHILEHSVLGGSEKYPGQGTVRGITQRLAGDIRQRVHVSR
jgi:presequence protease